jgi:hypothetical protein
MKEKEKNIYGIHQCTLTRRRKVRGTRKGNKRSNQTKKEKKKQFKQLCFVCMWKKKRYTYEYTLTCLKKEKQVMKEKTSNGNQTVNNT